MPSLKTLTGSVEAGKIKGILLLVLVLPPTLVHSGCVGLAGSNSLPLALSNPAPSSVSSNSAMVSWTTNAPGTSQVEYGTTTNYGLKTVFDPTLVTNQSPPKKATGSFFTSSTPAGRHWCPRSGTTSGLSPCCMSLAATKAEALAAPRSEVGALHPLSFYLFFTFGVNYADPPTTRRVRLSARKDCVRTPIPPLSHYPGARKLIVAQHLEAA